MLEQQDGGLGRNLIGSYYAFVHAGLKFSSRCYANWQRSTAEEPPQELQQAPVREVGMAEIS
ncbi:hypothetical protein [Paracandidimonas soli]|uniref:hypothetical protein n=1 Tax=Paracandidimonas soli TaxID=1917182 RepID=UPI001FB313DF|nr:hypothetical protein [Paracandidimonas soli]